MAGSGSSESGPSESVSGGAANEENGGSSDALNQYGPPPESREADTHDDGSGVEPVAVPKRKRPRNRVRRAVIAMGFGVVGVGYLQSTAVATDHQIANMGTVLLCLVLGGYILFQLHCLARTRWNGLVVPLGTLLAIAGFAGLCKFEGFSGEMRPQFSFRFGSARPAMRTVDAAARESTGVDSAEGSGVMDSDAATAITPSHGFLGNDRTAVIPNRQFSVPQSADEVKMLWRQGLGAGWSAFAVAGNRAVTLEQRGDQEWLTCYRLGDGELMWGVKHDSLHQNLLGGVGPRSTPTIVGDRVFAQGATGMVWCVELSSGEIVWRVDLLALAGWGQLESEEMITWGRAASPLVIDETICVLPFGGPAANAETGRSLIALDAKSGEILWAAGKGQISYASPSLLTLGDKRQIVSVNESTITGHAIDDGNVLWEVAWPGQSNGGANCAMAMPAGKNRFLIGKGYGGGSGLYEVTCPNGRWDAIANWKSNRVLKTKFTHAAVVGEVAFAISNGSLEAVRVEDGERQWIQGRRTRLGQGQIMIVDDVIVGQSEAGEVVFAAADASEYRELLRIPALDGKTWNIPTVAGRHLLVRNDREVICFLLPELQGDVPPSNVAQ